MRLLHDADAIAHIALNGAIAWLSFRGYRRTGLRFFILILAGALLQACLSASLQMHGYAFRPSDDSLFYYVYRAGVLIALGLFGTGLILLIRHVLRSTRV